MNGLDSVGWQRSAHIDKMFTLGQVDGKRPIGSDVGFPYDPLVNGHLRKVVAACSDSGARQRPSSVNNNSAMNSMSRGGDSLGMSIVFTSCVDDLVSA